MGDSTLGMQGNKKGECEFHGRILLDFFNPKGKGQRGIISSSFTFFSRKQKQDARVSWENSFDTMHGKEKLEFYFACGHFILQQHQTFVFYFLFSK